MDTTVPGKPRKKKGSRSHEPSIPGEERPGESILTVSCRTASSGAVKSASGTVSRNTVKSGEAASSGAERHTQQGMYPDGHHPRKSASSGADERASYSAHGADSEGSEFMDRHTGRVSPTRRPPAHDHMNGMESPEDDTDLEDEGADSAWDGTPRDLMRRDSRDHESRQSIESEETEQGSESENDEDRESCDHSDREQEGDGEDEHGEVPHGDLDLEGQYIFRPRAMWIPNALNDDQMRRIVRMLRLDPSYAGVTRRLPKAPTKSAVYRSYEEEREYYDRLGIWRRRCSEFLARQTIETGGTLTPRMLADPYIKRCWDERERLREEEEGVSPAAGNGRRRSPSPRPERRENTRKDEEAYYGYPPERYPRGRGRGGRSRGGRGRGGRGSRGMGYRGRGGPTRFFRRESFKRASPDIDHGPPRKNPTYADFMERDVQQLHDARRMTQTFELISHADTIRWRPERKDLDLHRLTGYIIGTIKTSQIYRGERDFFDEYIAPAPQNEPERAKARRVDAGVENSQRHWLKMREAVRRNIQSGARSPLEKRQGGLITSNYQQSRLSAPRFWIFYISKETYRYRGSRYSSLLDAWAYDFACFMGMPQTYLRELEGKLGRAIHHPDHTDPTKQFDALCREFEQLEIDVRSVGERSDIPDDIMEKYVDAYYKSTAFYNMGKHVLATLYWGAPELAEARELLIREAERAEREGQCAVVAHDFIEGSMEASLAEKVAQWFPKDFLLVPQQYTGMLYAGASEMLLTKCRAARGRRRGPSRPVVPHPIPQRPSREEESEPDLPPPPEKAPDVPQVDRDELEATMNGQTSDRGSRSPAQSITGHRTHAKQARPRGSVVTLPSTAGIIHTVPGGRGKIARIPKEKEERETTMDKPMEARDIVERMQDLGTPSSVSPPTDGNQNGLDPRCAGYWATPMGKTGRRAASEVEPISTQNSCTILSKEEDTNMEGHESETGVSIESTARIPELGTGPPNDVPTAETPKAMEQ